MTSEAPSTAAALSAKPASGPGRATTLLRAVVSVALLVLIASRIDLGAISGALETLHWWWVAAGAAVVYACVAISAFKWDVLLASRGHHVGFWRLVRHYFVGFFFNNFLPTSVGGDVVRAWECGRDLGDVPEAAASVVAERLIASVGLALTAALGLLFVPAVPQAYLAVAVVFAGGVGLAALFAVPSFSQRMVRSAMGSRFEGVAGWLARATRATGELLTNWRTSAVVLLLSIGFQVLVAAVNWCLFRALGTPVSLATCVVYTSVVSAVTMVPISISGHGVREAGYAYFFGLAGVPAAAAVTASLLFFALVAVCTSPGAWLFAAGRRKARA